MMVQYSDAEMLQATSEVVNQISHDCKSVGRLQPKMTSRVIRLAIEMWPPIVPLPHPIVGKDAHHEAAKVTRERIRRAYQDTYGLGIIATIFLSAIIQQVVAAILRRWWGNHSTFRQSMRLAQTGMRGPE